MATSTETQPLSIGTKAPDFDLPASQHEGNVKLSDYAGKNLVIVFYPKDATPGCTKQLCALQEDREMFRGINAEVLASNFGSVESHEKFSENQGYKFPILVDADKSMATAYQALKPEGGIQRTVYVIDKNGMIQFAQQGMPTDAELAEAIKNFS